MIKITIELISAINPSRNELLGIMTLANDGKVTAQSGGKFGRYTAVLSKRGNKGIWKMGIVEKFDRKLRGVYDLMYLALKNIVGDRNL